MQEAVAALPNGIEIAYETFGDPADRPLLLIMGLGGPALWWDLALCEKLAQRGFHVIRYDNRDIGRSTQFRDHRVGRRQIVRAFLGRPADVPYTMQDFADDGFGLLDHLGIESAHLVGVSMGGMIAQTMAISRPHRVRSLVSVMSTTGRRTVGWQDPRLLPLLIGRAALSREAYLRRSAKVWRAIGSPRYPLPDDVRTTRAHETWDRGVHPAGVARQMLAVLTQPDRTRALGGLRMPVTVIHGTHDKMVHPSGGRATAAAVPGSELIMLEGVGHDIPPALHDLFVDALVRTADRGDAQRADDQLSEGSSSSSSSKALRR